MGGRQNLPPKESFSLALQMKKGCGIFSIEWLGWQE